MLATELADYLVARSVPFREAHAITGRIVRWALDEGKELGELSVSELQEFSKHFDAAVRSRLTVQGAIDRKVQIGGTARKQVERRLKEWEKETRLTHGLLRISIALVMLSRHRMWDRRASSRTGRRGHRASH